MEYNYVYFLTNDDEKKEKNICFWYGNAEKKLNEKIQNLFDTKNLKIIRYKEYEVFNEKYNMVYYNGYTSNDIKRPLRGILYIRINKNYYVSNDEYSEKKWFFYDRLYKYIFSAFGLKGIKNNKKNVNNMNNDIDLGFNAIGANIGFNLNNLENNDKNISKTMEFGRVDDLDIIILNFNNQSYDEKILFLTNLIESKDKQNVFSPSIEDEYYLIKFRTENKMNIIDRKISIKNTEIRNVALCLEEKISGFNIGISGGNKNKVVKDEIINLNIIFFDYNKKENNIDKFLPQNVDVNSKLCNSNTSLIEAVWHQDFQAVKILVEKGADINKKQGDGITPLMFAVEKGNLKIAEYLINKGADINSRAKNKNTPLIIATFHGQDECVKLLINNNANVNLKQCDGFTALHFAAEKDFIDVAKVLIKGGADRNIKNLRNQTCVDMARNHGEDGDVIIFFNSL
jgi:hypothetical protein